MKSKKFIAIFMASMIAASACSSVVSAESYQATEKAEFAQWLQNYIALYQKNLDMIGDSPSVTEDISVSISDTSRALLGFMSPVDISWLNNVGLTFDVTMANGSENIAGTIYVNDHTVCNLEFYMDIAAQKMYARIPELHDSYIYLDMAMASEGSEELTASMELLQNPVSLNPDPATLKTLLTRYSEILFDGFGESIAGDDTLSVEGVGEACKTYKGIMQVEDAQKFMIKLLTTAKEDNELKTLIEEWAPLLDMESESGDIYIDFRSGINDLLEDLEEDSYENDGTYVSSKVWVDSDNNIVGREIGFCDYTEAEEEIYFKYYAPSTDTETALFAEINIDGESFAISGKGTVTEGKVSGTYDILYDNVVTASIDVVDYVPADLNTGVVNGSYTIKVQPDILPEEYAFLSDFDLVVDCVSNPETYDSTYALTVNMSGAALGALNISAGYCDPVTAPDFTSYANVLDFANEEHLTTFVTEMDWMPVLKNCIAAGMPEDVASMLDELIYNALYGAPYEDEYYDDAYYDDYYEDAYEDDYYDDSYEDEYYDDTYENSYDEVPSEIPSDEDVEVPAEVPSDESM